MKPRLMILSSILFLLASNICQNRLFSQSPSEVTNTIGMKLKLIPKGTFLMGFPPEALQGELAFIPEKQHKVTISKSFYIGVYEVTQSQYEKLMGTNPSYFQKKSVNIPALRPANGAGPASNAQITITPYDGDSSTNPVEQVTWNDAVEFCKRLSELPEEKKAGRVYRLPTEAEWEYACRAGSKTVYSFGDDPKSLGNFAWFGENSKEQTHPVGEKKPNAWGLYDMHGNVWEWCSDWFGWYRIEAETDPEGPRAGQHRVSRGGCSINDSMLCGSAQRSPYSPLSRSAYAGFRVAVSFTGTQK